MGMLSITLSLPRLFCLAGCGKGFPGLCKQRGPYAKPVPVVYGYIYREREIENPDKALREKIKRETRRETESER